MDVDSIASDTEVGKADEVGHHGVEMELVGRCTFLA